MNSIPASNTVRAVTVSAGRKERPAAKRRTHIQENCESASINNARTAAESGKKEEGMLDKEQAEPESPLPSKEEIDEAIEKLYPEL